MKQRIIDLLNPFTAFRFNERVIAYCTRYPFDGDFELVQLITPVVTYCTYVFTKFLVIYIVVSSLFQTLSGKSSLDNFLATVLLFLFAGIFFFPLLENAIDDFLNMYGVEGFEKEKAKR